MYGTECVKGFYTYSPNPNVYEQKLEEATKYFDEFVYVEPTSDLDELTTLIVEDTN
jgi:hypothetical protein